MTMKNNKHWQQNFFASAARTPPDALSAPTTVIIIVDEFYSAPTPTVQRSVELSSWLKNLTTSGTSPSIL